MVLAVVDEEVEKTLLTDDADVMVGRGETDTKRGRLLLGAEGALGVVAGTEALSLKKKENTFVTK